MTREEILALPAGALLDSNVAEHVMGWKRTNASPTADENMVYRYETAHIHGLICVCEQYHDNDEWPRKWAPSRSIADAWEVVEKVRNTAEPLTGKHDGEPVYLWYFSLFDGALQAEEWTATFIWNRVLSKRMSAETAPLAICRAALLVVAKQ